MTARTAALIVGLVIVVPAVFGAAYLWAPGPVSPDSLGRSVSRELGGELERTPDDARCRRVAKATDDWSCALTDPSGSGGGTAYDVKVGDWGCWEATRTGPAVPSETRFPGSVDDCVRLGDALRLGKRFLALF